LKNQIEEYFSPHWQAALHARRLSKRFLSHVSCLALFFSTLSNGALSSETAKPATSSANQAANSQLAIWEEHVGPKVFLVGRIVINIPIERVWDLLTDYAHTPSLFLNLKKSEVLSTNGNIKIIKQLVCPKTNPFKFDYIVEVTENEPTHIGWHRIAGSLKEITGSWELQPIEDNRATLTTYRIFLDGGFFLPPWLLRLQMKGYLPRMLVNFKQATECNER
jgi:uncharacterized membrane protein